MLRGLFSVWLYTLSVSFSYHLQGQIATRTHRWYQPAERWRLMSVQSATAHTRRAHGRLSVRPPAVRTSASGARDWHQSEGTLARNTSANPHVNSRPFTKSTGHQGRTAALEHFSIYSHSCITEKNAFMKVYNPHTEYLFIYVLNYLWIYTNIGVINAELVNKYFL